MTEALSKLLIWLSPSFPVGAFAYSHGLEWAAKAGLVTDETSLRRWLRTLVEACSWRNDAIILALAMDHVAGEERESLAELTTLALALCPSRERYQETVQQGNALRLAGKAAWPCPSLDWIAGDTPYPVALALLCAGHGLSKGQVLPLYASAFLQNLVSASIRLSIIGQSAGQSILAALLPVLLHEAQQAETAQLADLHNSAFMSDFASMQHEAQYTRIFRS